jgi:hypothetical protein
MWGHWEPCDLWIVIAKQVSWAVTMPRNSAEMVSTGLLDEMNEYVAQLAHE